MRRVRSALGAGLVALAVLIPTQTALAQTDAGVNDAGDVVVTEAANVNRAMGSGDSTSTFSLRLPQGASCQGDSANDDWRVSTFLVPADTNLDTLTYRATRPDGELYRSLRQLNGDIFVMQFTGANPGPGQPGLISAIPPLTMAWYEAGSLAPGTYKIGVACTDPSFVVQRYWDNTVELVAAPEVDPGGLRWAVVTPSTLTQPDSSSSSSTTWAALLSAFIVIAGAVLIRRQRRRLSPHNQKETV